MNSSIWQNSALKLSHGIFGTHRETWPRLGKSSHRGPLTDHLFQALGAGIKKTVVGTDDVFANGPFDVRRLFGFQRGEQVFVRRDDVSQFFNADAPQRADEGKERRGQVVEHLRQRLVARSPPDVAVEVEVN